MKSRIIQPSETQLAVVVYTEGVFKKNGPLYQLDSLRQSSLTKEHGLSTRDLLPSYSVVINPKRGRGGEKGHYHQEKEEIFVLKDGELILFLSDLARNREAIHFDTRAPPKMKEGKKFSFPVIYVPTGVSHYVYNPTKNKQVLDVLSRTSHEQAKEDTHEFDAVDESLEAVLEELAGMTFSQNKSD